MVHLEESVQTLNFASRAKKIKTKAAANVMRSPAEMMLMIEKLKAEVKALRAQLEENGIKPNISAYKLKAGEDASQEEAKQDEINDEEPTLEDAEEVQDNEPADDDDVLEATTDTLNADAEDASQLVGRQNQVYNQAAAANVDDSKPYVPSMTASEGSSFQTAAMNQTLTEEVA